MIDTVRQITARVPAWRDTRDLQIERIAELTNANYRVTVDGERFVLRVSGQNTAQPGINRGHELANLQLTGLAKHG